MEVLFNCVQLKLGFPKNLTHEAVVYVEGVNDEATRYFKKHGVKSVKPFRTFRMDEDERYTFVGCEVRKSEVDTFNEALYEMQIQMLILGYRDYEEFCKKAFVKLGLLKEKT